MPINDTPIESLVKKYIDTLSTEELKSMETARKLLKMTFDTKKSNGFLTWLKNN
tara:strand:- start:738 stop:899 length:162 start_codon:yes stop_codon:yes gene_type:complete